MKKKFISLLMVFVLALGSTMMVSAEEYLEEPAALELTEMSGADAIAHIGDENSVFLDLRAAVDYEAGHIKNTISAPVCLSAAEGYKVPVSNRDAFVAQMAELKVAENNTTIYLSCYAGTFCVNYAADWLINNCGVAQSQLVRVLGGTFGDADLAEASVFVSADHALAQVAAGGSLVLDVRATEVYYANGYLDGSLHMPLFNRVDGSNVVTDRQDALAQNFNAFIEANRELLTNNDVYILCNGGASGAAAATALFKQAGFEIAGHVFTIEGGANALQPARPELFVNQQYVTGAETVAITGTATVPSATDANAVVINVRAVERYDVGHLKSVPNYPLFTVNAEDKNVVTSGYDKLAMDFLAKVEANRDFFGDKDIYVVCNGGASGAKAATKLLMQAGYSNSKIFTVEGGYGGTETDTSVKDNSKFVSPAQAERVVGNDAYVILDVRAVERYEVNTLEGAISLPLFTADGDSNIPVQAPYEDELSMAFKQYVADNKEELSGKTIYILCNSGETGARNATVLLNEAGLVDNVYSIDGGAKALGLNVPAPVVPDEPEVDDPVVDEPEVDEPGVDEPEVDEPEVDEPETDEPETDEDAAPKTGDTTPIMGYALAMFAAAAVIVVSKRRLTK